MLRAIGVIVVIVLAATVLGMIGARLSPTAARAIPFLMPLAFCREIRAQGRTRRDLAGANFITPGAAFLAAPGVPAGVATATDNQGFQNRILRVKWSYRF
ncbi:MAG: hypothetical protein ACLPKB_18565 [Xanthobacteraceae bacterium]